MFKLKLKIITLPTTLKQAFCQILYLSYPLSPFKVLLK